MLKFHASTYVFVLDQLRSMEGLLASLNPADKGGELASESTEAVWVHLRESLRSIGLTMSIKQVDRITSEAHTHVDLGLAVGELRRRIHDELDGRLFLYVPVERAQYFNNSGYDASVASAFPEATIDIEEASKCFALGRWTACVFHLMRVTEHGMRALAAYLSVPCDFKTWEPVIRKMRTEVGDYNASSFKGNLDFIRQTLDRLTAVQTALRNEVMHSRSFYDEERASDVYAAVKGFMRQLATQLKAAP